MHSIQPVSFKNRDGFRLNGTLHMPREPRPGAPAVVLLSPGVKMRVGPGRLYVPVTGLLNDMGLTVLRFDFHGLGDSEGEISETLLIEIYNHVEVGRYVDDALCAVRWMREQHGFHDFILGGLCGGAVTAVLAADRDPEIRRLLLLGLAITLSGDVTPAKYLTRAELDSRLGKYFRRLKEPRSWIRLLTFQSEYDVIWRALKRLVTRDSPAPESFVPGDASTHMENVNPLFPPAFFHFLERGGQVLVVFSQKDRLPSEFEEKFSTPFASRLAQFSGQMTLETIADANHVISMSQWRRDMLARTQAWMRASLGR